MARQDMDADQVDTLFKLIGKKTEQEVKQHGELKNDIKQVTGDQATIRTDIGRVAGQQTAIKSDIQKLATDQTGIKKDVSQLTGDQASIRQGMGEIVADQAGIKRGISELTAGQVQIGADIGMVATDQAGIGRNVERMSGAQAQIRASMDQLSEDQADMKKNLGQVARDQADIKNDTQQITEHNAFLRKLTEFPTSLPGQMVQRVGEWQCSFFHIRSQHLQQKIEQQQKIHDESWGRPCGWITTAYGYKVVLPCLGLFDPKKTNALKEMNRLRQKKEEDLDTFQKCTQHFSPGRQ